jgi:hypothetical protein
MSAEF